MKNHNFNTNLPDREKTERKHCIDCCFYLDGKKMISEENSPLFFPLPGMQHWRRSKGTAYERFGTTTPCRCASGDMVSDGFKRNLEFPSRKILGFERVRDFNPSDSPHNAGLTIAENVAPSMLKNFEPLKSWYGE